MEFNVYEILAAARGHMPEVKWAYTKCNDAVSELMPIFCGNYWATGRLYAAYDPTQKKIIRVENYCVYDALRFSSQEEAQAHIDKLVF